MSKEDFNEKKDAIKRHGLLYHIKLANGKDFNEEVEAQVKDSIEANMDSIIADEPSNPVDLDELFAPLTEEEMEESTASVTSQTE